MIIKIDDPSCFKLCIDTLKAGHVVILPTDTIYGFSGIVPITNEKILQIKNRESSKPMIQLIGNPNDVYKYTDQIIPKTFFNLWPGALTLIVKAKNEKDTIGFRCPDSKWLRDLIITVGYPLYSSSVNISGTQNLKNISQIAKAFEYKVSLIVDAGELNGLPSTLVDLTHDEPMILRRGCLDL